MQQTSSNAENLSEKGEEITAVEHPNASAVLTQIELSRQRSRARRQARYAEVHRLKREGLTERAIARQDVQTICPLVQEFMQMVRTHSAKSFGS